jgi:hypothetical protein
MKFVLHGRFVLTYKGKAHPFFQVFIASLLALVVAPALAQSPITLTVDTQPGSHDAVPADFGGVSIFTGTQASGHHGVPGNLFSSTNTQLITLFKNSGIHHLRLGATESLGSMEPNLDHADIDALFAFAKATGIKIIYSLHALDGTATAKYVWDHYRPYVDYFAFDNEPDNLQLGGSGTAVGNYENYLAGWRNFATAVTNATPGAKFAGPDAAGRTMAQRFAKDGKDSGTVALVTQHFYVGGNSLKRGLSVQQAIDEMLSKDWDTKKYPELYDKVLLPVMTEGFPYRLTESDDYVHGLENASNSFASALWALDYMHWWAEHAASGVDFQNTEWLYTDTFYPSPSGNYQIHPKAYALKAFDLGGQGGVEPVAIVNTNALNLTAYAIGDAATVYVTIINKEHGVDARDASVTILAKGLAPAHAGVMYLAAAKGDVGATSGITLGGASITNNAQWQGQWTTLRPVKNSQYVLTVPAASAAVVKILSY